MAVQPDEKKWPVKLRVVRRRQLVYRRQVKPGGNPCGWPSEEAGVFEGCMPNPKMDLLCQGIVGERSVSVGCVALALIAHRPAIRARETPTAVASSSLRPSGWKMVLGGQKFPKLDPSDIS